MLLFLYIYTYNLKACMNKGIIYLNVSTQYLKTKMYKIVYQMLFFYSILGVIELCKL